MLKEKKQPKPILGEAAIRAWQGKETRGLTTTADSQPIDTEQLGELISYLGFYNPLADLGVRFVTGKNYLKYPRVLDKLGVQWKAEGETSDVGDVTLDALTPIWKTLRTRVLKVSREWVEDAGEIGKQMIDEVINLALNEEIVRVLLYGASGSGEPVGIVNTTGVETVAGGTLTDYDPFVEAMFKVAGNNVPLQNISMVHPINVGYQLSVLKDLEDRYLAPPTAFANMKKVGTTAVTESSTTQCVIGDFSQAVIGMNMPVKLQLVERYADELMVGFIAYLRMDTTFLRPNNFCLLNAINTVELT